MKTERLDGNIWRAVWQSGAMVALAIFIPLTLAPHHRIE